MNHNHQNGIRAIVPIQNGPLLHHLRQSLTVLDASAPSISVKWSMRSSTVRKPAVSGECSQKTFPTGGTCGTTTICGRKMAHGSASTMRYANRCAARKDAMENHHLVSLIVNPSRLQK